MKLEKALSYKDISLVPRVISDKEHRNGDTSIECFGIQLDVPIIASPMPDVCNSNMAEHLSSTGCLGIIHRFQSIENQAKQYEIATITGIGKLNKTFAACAIGVTDDYQERFKKLYEAECRIFCLDTANGANRLVEKAVKWIREQKQKKILYTRTSIQYKYDKIYLIAGNVATKEGYRFLADLEVDAVRVGIAGGSVCETKTETGVYYPMVSSISECVEERKQIAHKYAEYHPNRTRGDNSNYHKLREEKLKQLPLIIADGGIKEPSDLCKALAVGADLVMCGSIFAGTRQAPGDVLKIDGKKYKLYRGAASFSVQKETNPDKDITYNEGNETLVSYKGDVEKVVKRFEAGLKSSMSYMNANNLEEFRKNVSFTGV